MENTEDHEVLFSTLYAAAIAGLKELQLMFRSVESRSHRVHLNARSLVRLGTNVSPRVRARTRSLAYVH